MEYRIEGSIDDMMEIAIRNHPNWRMPYSMENLESLASARGLITRDDWVVGSFVDPEGNRFLKVTLTNDELDRLGNVAMGFHGLVRLIESEGFDEASGAREILQMIYRDFARLIAEIRERADASEA